MIQLKHRTLILISGLIWFVVGAFLLPLGLHFILESTKIPFSGEFPLIHFLTQKLGDAEQGAIIIIAIGLTIGFFKGRYVLSKSVHRLVSRIRGLSEPAPLSQMYPPVYYLLLGSMIGLGISIKYLGVPADIRGLIDVAVGSALINGSMIFFRKCNEACLES